EQYYAKWSSKRFIAQVEVPLLIVNAKNDPLLSKNCYPYDECERSQYVFLETPIFGGHTGFTRKKDNKPWYLWRIESFIVGALS
ncbi:MAG: alpha/beta hydrolase, partial [Bacteroidota bacterium]